MTLTKIYQWIATILLIITLKQDNLIGCFIPEKIYSFKLIIVSNFSENNLIDDENMDVSTLLIHQCYRFERGKCI